MKTVITYDDILALNPCYNPIKYIPKDWKGTVLDICNMDDVKSEDKLWVVLREEFISEKVLRLFAVACCREIQHLMTDPRSLKALDVAEAYANGKATKEELRTAANAAYAANVAAAFAATAYAATYMATTAAHAASADAYYAAHASAANASAAYGDAGARTKQIEIFKNLIERYEK